MYETMVRIKYMVILSLPTVQHWIPAFHSAQGVRLHEIQSRGGRLQKVTKQLGFETCFGTEDDFLENFCEFLES